VFARLCTWLDNRTGYRKLVQALLLEHIPGGAKWRYVWGSCLAFVFTLQVITGILLMTAYSPGDTSAWGSVYFIQYEMEFGWLIRGLHHFGSQAMVVLLGIHMLQVVIAGAHLAPREINWWLGLALMGLVLAMSLTGYLLPWDQKGYWATQVATSIAGGVPLVGSFLRTFIVGGPEYGNATLTRFYALHVGLIPALIVVLLIAHIAVFRRHGVTAPKDAEGEALFWPDQAFKDMVACMLIFGVMLAIVIWGGQGNPVDAAAFQRAPAEAAGAPEEPGWWQRVALAGRDGRGANLDAPADRGGSYPARPEWYFLFLFQLLKYFPGDQMIIGTVVIPSGVGLLLFLLPLLGVGRLRTFGHVLGVIVVVSLLSAVASLTCLALADDMADPLRRRLLTLLAHRGIPTTAGFFLLYLGVLALMGRGAGRNRVSFVGGLVALLLLLGNGSLIYGAMSGALPDPVWSLLESQQTAQNAEQTRLEKEATKKAEGFRHQLELADVDAHRAVELAAAGIPAEGAVLLLQRDPKTQGPKLFKLHCGGCHSYNLRDGYDDFHEPRDKATFTASDLAGFASKKWIHGLLTSPNDHRYFGNTPFKDGTMSDWVSETWGEDPDKLRQEDPKKFQEINEKLKRIAAWLGTHPKAPPKKDDPEELVKGWKEFKADCRRCHSFAGEGGGSKASRGPDLTGYGSAEWLRLMIVDPHDPLRYGGRTGKRPLNAMPLFRDKQALTWDIELLHLDRQREALLQPLLKDVPENNEEAAARVRKQNEASRQKIARATEVQQLTPVERELIIRWLTGDHRIVMGGSPITGPRKR
jgi:quinol-cytochrome oxidoreductase complex cytochrome b subunit/mono/diheme cytochrome c family protein